MNPQNSQLAYQEAVVRNASPIDLVIILYDVLARDLQKAISAMQAHHIEERSRHLKHGFLVLQQLDETLHVQQGGDLVGAMGKFYGMIRNQMMVAQVQQDPSVLQRVLELLFSVRESWMELKTRLAASDQGSSRQKPKSLYGETELRSESWNG